MKLATVFSSGLLVLFPILVNAIPNPQESTTFPEGTTTNIETFPSILPSTGTFSFPTESLTGSVSIPESSLISTDTGISTDTSFTDTIIPTTTPLTTSPIPTTPPTTTRLTTSTTPRTTSSQTSASAITTTNAAVANKAGSVAAGGLIAGLLAALI